jgi:hypothetical protein
MLKLTKKSAAQWNGNGFGSSTAEWVVKGHENIEVFQLGLYWIAADTAHGMNRKICRGDTKADVVAQLTAELA